MTLDESTLRTLVRALVAYQRYEVWIQKPFSSVEEEDQYQVLKAAEGQRVAEDWADRRAARRAIREADNFIAELFTEPVLHWLPPESAGVACQPDVCFPNATRSEARVTCLECLRKMAAIRLEKITATR